MWLAGGTWGVTAVGVSDLLGATMGDPALTGGSGSTGAAGLVYFKGGAKCVRDDTPLSISGVSLIYLPLGCLFFKQKVQLGGRTVLTSREVGAITFVNAYASLSVKTTLHYTHSQTSYVGIKKNVVLMRIALRYD